MLYKFLNSLASISGLTYALIASIENGFTVNWVKGSSHNDDVIRR